MREKILIIGAGISGLTAGIYAAKAGYEVTLYEKHTIAGGECTGWDRQGYHIDNCIHWLMGTTPGTELYETWKTVGVVGEHIKIHRNDRMYTSWLNGQSLTLWQDIDRTEQEMKALSPEDAPAISKLMDSCRIAKKVQIPAKKPPEMFRALDGIKMMKSMSPALKLFSRYKGMDTRDLAAQFKHPLIRSVLSDFCTEESLAHSFPMAYGNFVSGDGGIPEGGSSATAMRMKTRFQELGGVLREGTEVVQILLDMGKDTGFSGRPEAGKAGTVKPARAIGVRLADGTAEYGNYIIPACDTSITFGKLMPEDYMGELLRSMYEDREAYPVYSTFQTAFALDCGQDPIEADEILDCANLCFAPGVKPRLTVKTYAYEPSFAPPGKQIIQTLLGGSEELYDYWKELGYDREAYKAKKAELAEKIRLELEFRYPACKGKLRLLDTWTPLTYQRYCGAYKGFYQSFTITKKSAKQPYPPAGIVGLPNVILAGQWINPPGGLPGAAISGKFAIQRIAGR